MNTSSSRLKPKERKRKYKPQQLIVASYNNVLHYMCLGRVSRLRWRGPSESKKDIKLMKCDWIAMAEVGEEHIGGRSQWPTKQVGIKI